MTATDSLSLVYEPITIGGLTVPNRVVRTAHVTRYAIGNVSDDLIAYHVARARGGVGLTILEATAADPSSVLAASALDDETSAGYRKLTEAIEPHGMRLFVQLWHGGHHYSQPGGQPPRGVSRVPSPVNSAPPIPLDTHEIAGIVHNFGAAARRAIDGGIHGIEVHAGHGYLVHQFLSTLTNNREDDYGGSPENRMRFLVEVLTSIRAAIGPGHPIGVRVGAGQAVGDLTEPEVIQVTSELVRLGLIDFVNASLGDYFGPHWVTGAMDRQTGYQLPSSGRITAAVAQIPRIVTGRFRNLGDVEEVLRSGQADMVSMVRAHIADPDIVRKTREGRAHEVRPCIGCNQGCLARTAGVDLRMGCTVNPTVGREQSLSEDLIGTTARPRRVVVIGGGPAGLEAARTARLRGHDVVLFEAQSRVGGAINVAALAPNLGGLHDIIDWLAAEVQRLGVDVRLDSPVDVAKTLDEHPDVVIVATGVRCERARAMAGSPGEPVPGIDLPHVLTASQAITADPASLGRACLVYDDIGQYESVAVVEHLLANGLDVTVATRLPAFAAAVDAGLRLEPALVRFAAAPGRLLGMHVRTQLRRISDLTASVRLPGQAEDLEIAADSVVVVTHKEGGEDMSNTLRSHLKDDVYVIGDASSARDLQTAIRDGHMVGRGLV